MANKLYIASIEARSGKSLVALGTMELLSRRLTKLGFFRPIIPDVQADNNIRLISSRYHLELPYETMYACSHDQAQDMAVGHVFRLCLRTCPPLRRVQSVCQCHEEGRQWILL